jgi:hypothetical protein
VEAAHIGVAAKGGVLTLTGEVSSFAEKYQPEQAAQTRFGGEGRRNEIEVKLRAAAGERMKTSLAPRPTQSSIMCSCLLTESRSWSAKAGSGSKARSIGSSTKRTLPKAPFGTCRVSGA